MSQQQEVNEVRLPYDIDDKSSNNLNLNDSPIKKHIISVFLTFFLFIVFIVFIIYIIINSSSQSSNQLLSASQSQALLGSGSYTSFTSNSQQFNVSSGSYISMLLGNNTAYVSEFYNPNYYYQELIVNRTNSSTIFSIIRFDMSHQLNKINVINGTVGPLSFFYTVNKINSTANLFTMIGKKNNTLVIMSMLYNNTSINKTINYIALDLNK